MPTYQVYYARKPVFHTGDALESPHLTVEALHSSHVRVCQVEADSLDDAWRMMQAENWSPRGEAREFIHSLGLTHTSISVGDVIRDEDGIFWECLDLGWRRIEDDTQGGTPHG